MARNPLTSVPATRSSMPLLKIRRRMILGVLSVSVASGVFSSIAWMTSDKTTPAPPQIPDQTAVSLAQTAVQDYLAARTSAVPAVADVSADFSKVDGTGTARQPLAVQSLTFDSATPSTLGDAAAQVETVQEKFTVTLAGKLYAITVPMVAGGDGQWLLGAQPAITPESTPADQSIKGIDYADLYSTLKGADGGTLPATYRTQIDTWAQTFAKAGRADSNLLLLVGDDSNRTYSGLDGWTLAQTADIKSFVPVQTPYPGYIVRVGLVLRSPATNGPTLSTDYDLYLRSDKSQQQPPVVAWGAAGSYRTLMPYMNADQP